MAFKLGVTTGLHYVARSEELATSIKKLGFGLTRGTTSIEIALDVPHEITETDGVQLRNIAKKQKVDVLMHGSLTIPMGLPERSDWRDAHDHIQKSIRSSVMAGAKYVDFHACLNVWLELMTTASRKLTLAFCDHKGRFISEILKECPQLREWFVERRGDMYIREILSSKEITELRNEVSVKVEAANSKEIKDKLSQAGFEQETIERVLQTNVFPDLRPQITRDMTEAEAEREIERTKERVKLGNKIMEEVRKDRIIRSSKIESTTTDRMMSDKLAAGGRWDSEELRGAQGILDGYHIMGHYMFFTRDRMWREMAKLYPILESEYGMDYDDPNWLEDAWRKAEKNNDRKFKEFFYGAVGAKFLEGHMEAALDWMKNTYIPKDLAGREELQNYARNLIFAIESPDARDSQHAGLHILWTTKQIYVAVKVIREELKKKGLNGNNVWMLADFEHVATQGVDPILDLEELIKYAPDLGKICISIHANAPNPSHAHEPLELGDIRVYKLLYYMTKTGFGQSGRDVYVIYERGGGDDPFKRSVEALRLMIRYLDPSLDSSNPISPEKLPAEFYGYKGAVAGDETRQRQIITEHAYEPLKDLMEMPDEEFGMLSKTVLAKGKRPEQWKKAEFR
jgi:hypothetical protein